jgi:hypothetical protein
MNQIARRLVPHPMRSMGETDEKPLALKGHGFSVVP